MATSLINPAILYWGTPVVLITTTNPDGSANIGPMSSAFWLGDRCVLGLAAGSQTTLNLQRTRQCTLNLPSDDMTAAVNALACTTGTPDVPAYKVKRGYRFVKDKFGVAGLDAVASEVVVPPRIRQCPVQMEAELLAEHALTNVSGDGSPSFASTFEVRVVRTYVVDEIRLAGHANRVDSDKWKPMIMAFSKLYGLREREVESRLAEIDEDLYRPPKAVGPPLSAKEGSDSE